jgi:hypothetical protein
MRLRTGPRGAPPAERQRSPLSNQLQAACVSPGGRELHARPPGCTRPALWSRGQLPPEAGTASTCSKVWAASQGVLTRAHTLVAATAHCGTAGRASRVVQPQPKLAHHSLIRLQLLPCSQHTAGSAASTPALLLLPPHCPQTGTSWPLQAGLLLTGLLPGPAPAEPMSCQHAGRKAINWTKTVLAC